MNAEHELFGELHEQEENVLFVNEHRRKYEAQQEEFRLSVVGRSEQLCPDCGNTGRRLPQTLDSPDGLECECGAGA